MTLDPSAAVEADIFVAEDGRPWRAPTWPSADGVAVILCPSGGTVAKAKGVDLGADYLRQQLNFADRVPPETKSSMQMDLEAGRRLELDWTSGAVARIGDELGVPTSIHHFICAALKLYGGGSPVAYLLKVRPPIPRHFGK